MANVWGLSLCQEPVLRYVRGRFLGNCIIFLYNFPMIQKTVMIKSSIECALNNKQN